MDAIKFEVEIPKPMTEWPDSGEKYWYLDSTEFGGFDWTLWGGEVLDHAAFNNGIWKTKEEARQAAEAVFGGIKEQMK